MEILLSGISYNITAMLADLLISCCQQYFMLVLMRSIGFQCLSEPLSLVHQGLLRFVDQGGERFKLVTKPAH